MLAQKPDWVGVGSVSSAVRAAGLMNIRRGQLARVRVWNDTWSRLFMREMTQFPFHYEGANERSEVRAWNYRVFRPPDKVTSETGPRS